MKYLTRAYWLRAIIEAQTWEITLIALLITTGLSAQTLASVHTDFAITNTSTLETLEVSDPKFTNEVEFDFTVDDKGVVKQSFIRYSYNSLSTRDNVRFCTMSYMDANDKIYNKYPKLSIPKKTAAFLDNNAPIAIEVMNISGIPASVSLAQGIIESNSGTCPAAKQSNVIFNVWTAGNKLRIKAAKKLGIPIHVQYDEHEYRGFYGGSTLRQHYLEIYNNYLSGKGIFSGSKLYKPCFSFGYGDYTDWCKCLFWKGYATDPTYVNQLITVIEKYKLYYYDDYYWDNLQVEKRFSILYTIATKDLLFPAPWTKDNNKKRRKISGYINKEMNNWYARRKHKKEVKEAKASEKQFKELKRKIGGNRS